MVGGLLIHAGVTQRHVFASRPELARDGVATASGRRLPPHASLWAGGATVRAGALRFHPEPCEGQAQGASQ
jgi:hypothetical protein